MSDYFTKLPTYQAHEGSRANTSPDPLGAREIIMHLYNLSGEFDCGWLSGIEDITWEAVLAWREHRESIVLGSILGELDEDDSAEDLVRLDPAYLERLSFLARWAEGWVLHVSAECPHPSVALGFHGPIYVPMAEWLEIYSRRQQARLPRMPPVWAVVDLWRIAIHEHPR